MNYSNQWYIPHHVLYVRYWGESTAEIVLQQIDEMYAMLDESGADAVQVIMDVTQVTKPLSVKDYPRIISRFKAHPKYAWTLIIAQQNALVRFVSSVGVQLFGRHQRIFDTQDQALAFLKGLIPGVDLALADQSVLSDAVPGTD